MTQRIFFTIFLLVSALSYLHSQGIEGNAAQENLDKIGSIDYDIGVVRKFDNRYEGTKGSPFYLEEWISGSVEFESGRIAENLKLKFNIYENELLILDPKSGAIYINKNNVKSFSLQAENAQRDVFIKLADPKKADSYQYYRIIYNGKMNLLEHIKVVFEKANYQGGYSTNKTYDEFKKYKSYYFHNPGLPNPVKLKSTAGAISKAFPDHQGEIKKYINKNFLDCRTKEGLLKAFIYYDSLP